MVRKYLYKSRTFFIFKHPFVTDVVAFSRTYFGAGVDSLFLVGVGCSGSESSLTECPRSFTASCSWYSRGAGVRCQGNYKVIMFIMLIMITYSGAICQGGHCVCI